MGLVFTVANQGNSGGGKSIVIDFQIRITNYLQNRFQILFTGQERLIRTRLIRSST